MKVKFMALALSVFVMAFSMFAFSSVVRAEDGPNFEEMTQGQFALYLVKAAGATAKLPSAATGKDAIDFLQKLGVFPEDGWDKDKKVDRAFLLSLLGENDNSELSIADIVNRILELVDSHLSQQNLNVFSATSSASSSVVS